jgi:hypothetical protein
MSPMTKVGTIGSPFPHFLPEATQWVLQGTEPLQSVRVVAIVRIAVKPAARHVLKRAAQCASKAPLMRSTEPAGHDPLPKCEPSKSGREFHAESGLNVRHERRP